MTLAYLIGLILSFLGIYLFKNSRIKSQIEPERPVLKVWSLILFAFGALTPIFNIAMAILMITWWALSVYSDCDWVCEKNFVETPLAGKVIQFLNKPIK